MFLAQARGGEAKNFKMLADINGRPIRTDTPEKNDFPRGIRFSIWEYQNCYALFLVLLQDCLWGVFGLRPPSGCFQTVRVSFVLVKSDITISGSLSVLRLYSGYASLHSLNSLHTLSLSLRSDRFARGVLPVS